jgi:RNA polymerase sigma-70 factor (ECF subfamily)
MDEKSAVTRLKRGDLTGIEFLVQQYQVQAVHTAYLITGDRFLAEEIVQAVFLKLASKIDQFDMQYSFRPWFFRIIVNDAIKAAKRRRRYVSLDTLSESVLNWLNDPSQRPEELTESNETREAVWNAIQSLSPKQRAVIVQRHFLEMDEAEMVKELQRPPSSVKWWLHTARERLRELLVSYRTENIPAKPKQGRSPLSGEKYEEQ